MAFSATSLPPTPVVLLMVLIFMFDMNLFMCNHVITTTTNTVPYWRAVLIGGVLSVLAVIAVGEAGLGLTAILLTQLAIGLAYNYWRWPIVGFSVLDLRLRDLPRQVLAGVRRARPGAS